MGGCSRMSKPKVPRYQDMPKIQFSGVGWGVLESQNPKCQDQDMPKIQFSGVGWGVLESQNPKCQDIKICLKNFQGVGWGWGQDLPKFLYSGKSKPKVPRSA